MTDFTFHNPAFFTNICIGIQVSNSSQILVSYCDETFDVCRIFNGDCVTCLRKYFGTSVNVW